MVVAWAGLIMVLTAVAVAMWRSPRLWPTVGLAWGATVGQAVAQAVAAAAAEEEVEEDRIVRALAGAVEEAAVMSKETETETEIGT